MAHQWRLEDWCLKTTIGRSPAWEADTMTGPGDRGKTQETEVRSTNPSFLLRLEAARRDGVFSCCFRFFYFLALLPRIPPRPCVFSGSSGAATQASVPSDSGAHVRHTAKRLAIPERENGTGLVINSDSGVLQRLLGNGGYWGAGQTFFRNLHGRTRGAFENNLRRESPVLVIAILR